MYIDGKEENRTIDTTHDNNSDRETGNKSNLYLGCRGGKTNYFKGQVNGLSIFKKDFKESEIVQLMQTPENKPENKPENLLLSWQFNLCEENLINIIHDIINNINNVIEEFIKSSRKVSFFPFNSEASL